MKRYKVYWDDGRRTEYPTREAAVLAMETESGFMVDNGDADCLAWWEYEESLDDDGRLAVARLVVTEDA